MTDSVHGTGTAALRVLVVDDERVVLHATSALLEAHGIDTTTAADGAEASALARQVTRCDAVLLDLTMPGPSAADTLDSVRACWPGVPVVFTSGYPERDVLDPLLAQPSTAFLQKPYDATDLISTIDRLLTRHRTDAHR